ncbi:isochorismate synthase [Kocuria dechangensis]|uniref:isochorismate synthase n=1 Tax=Kocuria dechangensis TaxID=1176249 RepID=A0A917LSG3_9MICC|nr:chorismate-binding protein [Kocuria dechangensis]GGG55045.1 isochorismate synthase [Kocuria dechangensis]
MSPTDPAVDAAVAPVPVLHALTVPLSALGAGALPDLRDLLAGPDLLTWTIDGRGLVAHGRAAEHAVRGADRFTAARVWWDDVVSAAVVEDRVGVPGTGLAAFGAFTFAADSAADSGLVVPELLVGRDEHAAWASLVVAVAPGTPFRLTTEDVAAAWVRRFGHAPGAVTPPTALSAPASAPGAAATLSPGTLDEEEWTEAVREGVERIRAGRLEKLVLARDVVARLAAPLDPVAVVRDLAHRYERCWTYCVGFGADAAAGTGRVLGATPEMLVQVLDGVAHARVLAGTLDRDSAPVGEDPQEYAARVLGESEKQQHEHGFAIDSLVASLAPYTDVVATSPEPFILELPNVWHLASDVTAVLRPGPAGDPPSSLELAEALHPTAAVCGTPTAAAAATIPELEQMDRGLYAGPVGWLDAAGNGDWGIALRGAVQEDERTVRLYAGCGIVGASDPDSELAETWAKLRPMLQALGLRADPPGAVLAGGRVVPTGGTSPL